ncbi:zinc finger and BTB domain-containing protein 18-like isoform X2 [Plodia interpunctella]|uniref:zinc finger and BTB domain-containing protein 18-like isoform X2 n=1 Tax=Plodia interpunctella TaxID=58824 RepID=UPI0023689692|nr:zinc finger and BTB domain-containing protein 18-like isoform X2 [Plodia interpunctella]
MDQQFSLSWNNFHGNLSKGFAGLLGKGEFVDVTIAVEGHLLQAHKVILSICSPYFKKMFQLNPCQHPIVVLRDVTHKAMRDLLQFMYHGEVSVKREDLNSFISTAEVLQIKGLTNKETDDEDSEKEQDLSKHITENNTPDAESCVSDTCENNAIEETQSNEMEILKHRQFIEKLQRLSNLKRKSDEFLQKTYYSDLMNSEKRAKIKDKATYNHMSQNSNYENMKNLYEEKAVDISCVYNTQVPNSGSTEKETSERNKEYTTSENAVEVKTEFDDMDIIVTDPAVCTTPKNYENSRDGKKDLPLPLDYQSPQDSALSLVVNGSCENQQLPVRYKYIYSRKGHKQLVHMNFVYTKHSTTHGKTSWRCVQYFSLNRCPATVETIDSMIYAINHQHNHEDCFEKLARNNIYEMSASPK